MAQIVNENWLLWVGESVQPLLSDKLLGPFPRHERLTGKTHDGKHALWDIWGHYHGLLGLLLWHDETGYAPALAACRRLGDYLCRRFLNGPQRVRDAGAEEMNMAISHGLALLYQRTGEERYMRLLREVEQDWQTPPAGDYHRAALRGLPFYRTLKPRWESLHDLQALLSLYEITGEVSYRQAFAQVWHSIAQYDRHNTGGFSSGEQATGNPYDPRAIETCCTVAWMALSVDMLRLSADAQVADELELSFLNATLGAQSPSGRWWTYDTPMDGVRRASAHEIVFQAREGSSELNCCSVNGPRSLAMLSEWALMQGEGGLTLNYYGPCQLALVAPGGGALSLTQRTDYPRRGEVHLTLGLEQAQRFPLRLRIPGWSHQTSATLNGAPLSKVWPGRYLCLDREWHNGDALALSFDLTPRFWRGEREAAGKASLYRGPLLLAYDRRYNGMDPDALPPLDPAQVTLDAAPWSGSTPLLWLLVSTTTPDGCALRLCDYASAGMAGTPYRTWLPLVGES
jgi:hypothetical protein